jgi:membrane fusion protein (multidrug efflux system)
VEVRSGLKAGDQVVVAGKSALREGSAVKVLDSAASAQPAKAAQ